jgi:transcriptional regulator with XRE-family HTH domain
MAASSLERVTWSDFGRFLLGMRRRQGLSQERFAQLLGCHRTYLWRLEHGRNRPSSLFLHALLHSCNRAPQDVHFLAIFIRMREYRLDCIERAMDF